MASVNSSMSEEQIAAAYLDNCGFEEDGDVAKAAAFKTVLLAMRLRGITVIEEGGNRMEFSMKELADMERRASRFINARAGVAAGGAGATHVSFENFRN